MKILFAAGFGPIIQDQKESASLYRDTLGLPLKEDNGYYHTEDLAGVRHFALWPLSHAAQECFGTETWPKEIPVPQSWMELDVDDIDKATLELKEKGYKLLVSAKKQPWGQIVTRFLSPEGFLLSITHTPWMRKEK